MRACYFAPTTWAFWRVLITCFCICCLLGHALELPYCSSMDALFDIVEDDYAVFIDPWYVPYWVYGFGALGMTFVLEPLKERIIARKKTLAGALVEMFVIAVFLSMAMELAFGLLVNQPDATGTYPYWDNSTLPLNILQQAWLVNDVFIGFAAMVYLWVIFPFVSAGYSALGPRRAHRLRARHHVLPGLLHRDRVLSAGVGAGGSGRPLQLCVRRAGRAGPLP